LPVSTISTCASMAMARIWLMAEPSLLPLAQSSAKPNMISDPAMPGAMRVEASVAAVAVPRSTRSMPRSKRNMSWATVAVPNSTSAKPISQAIGRRLL
jgi:hypothetical protein